jgi:hypothetical protein
VTENWNKIPRHVKNVKTVSGFKRSYKKSQRAGCSSLEGKIFRVKMEGWSTTRGRHTPKGTSPSKQASREIAAKGKADS